MKKIKEVSVLISVGVDVSKGKSTVCILKPYGEVLMSPNDYEHTQRDLKKLVDQMDSFEDEIHVTMEATGNYHYPIATYLKKRDYDVRIVNPLEMKRYRCQGIRNPKTDSIDANALSLLIWIGAFFSGINSLITLHQRKCDALKELKKYMLQNMFPR